MRTLTRLILQLPHPALDLVWALRCRWLVFAKAGVGKVDAETMLMRDYVMNPAGQYPATRGRLPRTREPCADLHRLSGQADIPNALGTLDQC